ncbi:MAG: hypothetical protein Q4C05_08730 [Akkermansia sp.]|nr:hypothetical protein [Akkermansia sp.]
MRGKDTTYSHRGQHYYEALKDNHIILIASKKIEPKEGIGLSRSAMHYVVASKYK